MHIDITTDAARFSDDVEPFLRRDPLRHTVIATSVFNQIHGLFSGTRFVAVRADSGAVVGVAQSTASGHLYLGELPTGATAAVVDAFVARDLPLTDVEGEDSDAKALARHWSEPRRGSHRALYSTRLFRLGTLTPPVVAGRARLATAADLDICLEWGLAFEAEIGEPARFDETVVRRRIAARLWWLWEHDGVVTSLVARHKAVLGWARIGPVYTPPAQRGNGFASALTAAVAGTIRAEGADACLFTDLDNPTSNKIYAEIGFEPVRDFVRYRLDA
ncbi:GNAT family N-acetyltransferase [Nocardia lasii]|uniref:GNAT family N-acetyltransferase n=1 Tax=Nocardia lasii TaxID=1616107 RepID=A0ABW1JXR9_9NOCA